MEPDHFTFASYESTERWKKLYWRRRIRLNKADDPVAKGRVETTEEE